jgi:hypothetical protein
MIPFAIIKKNLATAASQEVLRTLIAALLFFKCPLKKRRIEQSQCRRAALLHLCVRPAILWWKKSAILRISAKLHGISRLSRLQFRLENPRQKKISMRRYGHCWKGPSEVSFSALAVSNLTSMRLCQCSISLRFTSCEKTLEKFSAAREV